MKMGWPNTNETSSCTQTPPIIPIQPRIKNQPRHPAKEIFSDRRGTWCIDPYSGVWKLATAVQTSLDWNQWLNRYAKLSGNQRKHCESANGQGQSFWRVNYSTCAMGFWRSRQAVAESSKKFWNQRSAFPRMTKFMTRRSVVRVPI